MEKPEKITVNKKYVLIGYAIQGILLKNKLFNAKPKDLMDGLIDKGFFQKDYRNGLPLRNIPRILDESNQLYLIPQASVERKDKNRFWFFNPVIL